VTTLIGAQFVRLRLDSGDELEVWVISEAEYDRLHKAARELSQLRELIQSKEAPNAD
jgi:hypothetical protein